MYEFPKSWVVVWNEIDGEYWLVRNRRGKERVLLRKEHPGEREAEMKALFS